MEAQSRKTLFSTTQQLVEMMEDRLLSSSKTPFVMLTKLRKEFVHPHFYIMNGMEFLLQNLMKIFIYMPSILLLTIFVSNKLGLPKQQVDAYSVIAIVASIVIVLFSLPSTFTNFGIKDVNVAFMADFITAEKFTKDELDAISDNVEIFEECAMNRVRTLRWAMATLWGLFLFACSQSLSFITHFSGKEEVVNVIGESIAPLIVTGIVALITSMMIAGYKRSNYMVFRGLQFACNEAMARISSEPAEQNTSHQLSVA